MNKLSYVKKAIYTAVCVALCVVLPLAFHGIKGAGSIFLPMHIPVILCALLCGAPFGLLCGILGPLASSLLTGMPPFGYMPKMMVELAIYGLLVGLLFTFVRTRCLWADLYISLIAGLVIGRVVYAVVNTLVFASGKFALSAWFASYFVKCLPGLLIQLIAIPLLYFALEKTHLIPMRYPAAKTN